MQTEQHDALKGFLCLLVTINQYLPEMEEAHRIKSGRHQPQAYQTRSAPSPVCWTGTGHGDRAHRVCLSCTYGAVGNERHVVFERAARASLRSWYASLFAQKCDRNTSVVVVVQQSGIISTHLRAALTCIYLTDH